MWRYSLESTAGSDSSKLSGLTGARLRWPELLRYLAEGALLLGFLLTSSWLVCR
jgi:hypothetical protein